jgi:hypothetical protein
MSRPTPGRTGGARSSPRGQGQGLAVTHHAQQVSTVAAGLASKQRAEGFASGKLRGRLPDSWAAAVVD